MIDAYTWKTPNGFKLLIALEELGLEYQPHWVDISKGQQLTPEYLAVNPNNKVPAIVDQDGPEGHPIAVFESGAVLIYLAEKAGKLLPKAPGERMATIEWTFFNAANAGPMIGQYQHFVKFAPEKVPYAIERYRKELHRICKVLDTRLEGREFLVGDDLTIADVINFTWPQTARASLGEDLSAYPNLVRWLDALAARPAFVKALAMRPPA